VPRPGRALRSMAGAAPSDPGCRQARRSRTPQTGRFREARDMNRSDKPVGTAQCNKRVLQKSSERRIDGSTARLAHGRTREPQQPAAPQPQPGNPGLARSIAHRTGRRSSNTASRRSWSRTMSRFRSREVPGTHVTSTGSADSHSEGATKDRTAASTGWSDRDQRQRPGTATREDRQGGEDAEQHRVSQRTVRT